MSSSSAAAAASVAAVVAEPNDFSIFDNVEIAKGEIMAEMREKLGNALELLCGGETEYKEHPVYPEVREFLESTDPDKPVFTAGVANAFLKICRGGKKLSDLCEFLRTSLYMLSLMHDPRVERLSLGAFTPDVRGDGKGQERIFSAAEQKEILEKNSRLHFAAFRETVQDILDAVAEEENLNELGRLVLERETMDFTLLREFYACTKEFYEDNKRALKSVQRLFLIVHAVQAVDLNEVMDVKVELSHIEHAQPRALAQYRRGNGGGGGGGGEEEESENGSENGGGDGDEESPRAPPYSPMNNSGKRKRGGIKQEEVDDEEGQGEVKKRKGAGRPKKK